MEQGGAASVFHLKCRAVFGFGLSSDIEPGGADMGMPGPMLEIVEIGTVVAGVTDGGDAHGMGRDTDGFLRDAGFPGVFSDHVAGDAVGCEPSR